MNKFGIFINPLHENTQPVFSLLKKLHKNYNLHLYKLTSQKNFLPDFVECIDVQSHQKLDCILVFGGDGTILRAVDFSLQTKAPLLGINIGKLGFLSESTLSNLEKSIENLEKNKFKVQERLLIKVILKRSSKVIFSSLALNDAVIYKGKDPKLMDVSFFANRRLVVETRCDGIIASTPTGSTAYSLSAGGPILSPLMEAFVVAPLNPHVLTVRPMVFSAKDNLLFKIIKTNEESVLQLDGKNSFSLESGDEISVSAANKKVNFIKLSNKTFYQILRKKLHMGRK